jgi:Flp pilus assembly protein TadG
VSSVELLLYTPLLMFIVFLAVQFALYYLGSQVVSSTAREAARIIRTGGTPAQAQNVAEAYARQIGNGIVSGVQVSPQTPSVPQNARVEVTGTPLTLVKLPQLSTVSAVSEGPLEIFRPDTGP